MKRKVTTLLFLCLLLSKPGNAQPGQLYATFNFDPTSTVYPNGYVKTSLVQPDGKIIIAGAFQYYNGISRRGIARINSDGSIDATFDPGTGLDVNGSINCMILQP